MGVYKRSAGIDKEVHRTRRQVAGKYRFDAAFLRKWARVFRDQVTRQSKELKTRKKSE